MGSSQDKQNGRKSEPYSGILGSFGFGGVPILAPCAHPRTVRRFNGCQWLPHGPLDAETLQRSNENGDASSQLPQMAYIGGSRSPTDAGRSAALAADAESYDQQNAARLGRADNPGGSGSPAGCEVWHILAMVLSGSGAMRRAEMVA